MTCEWVRLPQGGAAMVCRPPARRRKCQEPGCHAAGLFQCDHPTRRGTCDRYLCQGHRIAQGDGVDFCPKHGRQPVLPHFAGAS